MPHEMEYHSEGRLKNIRLGEELKQRLIRVGPQHEMDYPSFDILSRPGENGLSVFEMLAIDDGWTRLIRAYARSPKAVDRYVEERQMEKAASEFDPKAKLLFSWLFESQAPYRQWSSIF